MVEEKPSETDDAASTTAPEMLNISKGSISEDNITSMPPSQTTTLGFNTTTAMPEAKQTAKEKQISTTTSIPEIIPNESTSTKAESVSTSSNQIPILSSPATSNNTNSTYWSNNQMETTTDELLPFPPSPSNTNSPGSINNNPLIANDTETETSTTTISVTTNAPTENSTFRKEIYNSVSNQNKMMKNTFFGIYCILGLMVAVAVVLWRMRRRKSKSNFSTGYNGNNRKHSYAPIEKKDGDDESWDNWGACDDDEKSPVLPTTKQKIEDTPQLACPHSPHNNNSKINEDIFSNLGMVPNLSSRSNENNIAGGSFWNDPMNLNPFTVDNERSGKNAEQFI